VALLKTASFRDMETGEHLIRIRIYSSAIAMQLSVEGPYRSEIDRDFKSQLFRASPLHDIGKVGIADAILRKPGALTDAEFEAMKQHTVIGAEVLQQAAKKMPRADYLRMAVEVARHHHERFDGSGYPDGLAGAKIPLCARIVAAADALDALTSKRVYKAAKPIDEALQIIEASAGTHFDPTIVDALRKRIDVFRHIVDRCSAKAAIPLESHALCGFSADGSAI
jgi:putative two-component system response regulator